MNLKLLTKSGHQACVKSCVVVGMVFILSVGTLVASEPISSQFQSSEHWALNNPHWAFQPLRKSDVPKSRTDAATPDPLRSIDGFILQKLSTSGLTPSREADRVTMLRRISFDLLGLPPSAEWVREFASDTSSSGYSKWVDRLLAHPAFGERWGRHWLDGARYADSDGYEKDRARSEAWRYRDWVIRAFNDNLPFDQFTIQQIAGDLLSPQDMEATVATAFHRQTLTNDEGGVDKEQYRIEAVFDRVETIGSVWLGLTVGCARCHAHKYDPISQQEYYSLFAFFNNADEVKRLVPTQNELWTEFKKNYGSSADDYLEASWELSRERENFAPKLAGWEEAIQEVLRVAQKNSEQRFQLMELRNSSVQSGVFQTEVFGEIDHRITAHLFQYGFPSVQVTNLVRSIRLEFPKTLGPHSRSKEDKRDVAIYDLEVRIGKQWDTGRLTKLHSGTADSEAKEFPIGNVLDDSLRSHWRPGNNTNGIATLTFHFASPLRVGDGDIVHLRLIGRMGDDRAKGSEIQLSLSSDLTVASVAPEFVRRSLTEEPARRPLSETEALIEWAAWADPKVLMLDQRQRALRQQIPAPPLMEVRVIGERESAKRTTRLLKRGEFLSPAEEVEPGVPSVLPPPVRAAKDRRLNRLDLARWLVEEASFLTARVRVNQIWLRLFGEGLVSTPGDFGTRGDKPTHPELLDWLARRLLELKWDQKQLIREILHSKTYRQSSHERPDVVELNSRNRLFHRQNRWRIEGELVRDLFLSVSGLLNQTVGGPSVFPAMPEDVAALSYANNFKWTASQGGARYRRGLYTFFKRTAPHPDLMVFDCPDANFAVVRRHVSNTPLQALTTLNSEAFVEASRAFAVGLMRLPDLSTIQRLEQGFVLAIGRPPTHSQRERMLKLYEEGLHYFKAHRREAEEFLSVGPWIELDSLDISECAAWTTCMRALLNMDETLTRE